MQLYFPYQEPIKCAEYFSASVLREQISAAETALAKEHDEWLGRYKICLSRYADGNKEQAQWWSNHADYVRPEWLTPERCKADRKKLQKKNDY